jgi:hypothetical protein
VFVDPAWIKKVQPPNDLEKQMLECTAEPSDINRGLSCQSK